jgi:glycosyltransferase involved in cell wall biosynthesis
VQISGTSSVIPNWADDEAIFPVCHDENPLRSQWGLEDKFVVGYSGNLGRPHEFQTIIDAAARLHEQRDIVFLFIGGGYLMPKLVQLVQDRNLQAAFRFLPYQDRSALKYSLSVADVHWISLRPDLGDLMFPSKFYGIAASGRPMIAVTGHGNELARLVTASRCGVAIEPGDVDNLVTAISSIRFDKVQADDMGRQARSLIKNSFSKKIALQKWADLISKTSAG